MSEWLDELRAISRAWVNSNHRAGCLAGLDSRRDKRCGLVWGMLLTILRDIPGEGRGDDDDDKDTYRPIVRDLSDRTFVPCFLDKPHVITETSM